VLFQWQPKVHEKTYRNHTERTALYYMKGKRGKRIYPGYFLHIPGMKVIKATAIDQSGQCMFIYIIIMKKVTKMRGHNGTLVLYEWRREGHKNYIHLYIFPYIRLIWIIR
jgi:hypothetical protein